MVKVKVLKAILAFSLLAPSVSLSDCLAKNIYFEARGESLEGMLAVGIVTLNRVKSPNWPNSECGVVWQPKQFSWTWDGLSDKINDDKAYAQALYAARLARNLSKIKNADHYHNYTIWPNWADSKKLLGFVDKHMFYKLRK